MSHAAVGDLASSGRKRTLGMSAMGGKRTLLIQKVEASLFAAKGLKRMARWAGVWHQDESGGQEMIDDRKDKYFGATVKEWLHDLPGSLQYDAVGLWQIVPTGRDDFGLQGEELKDFVRRAVIRLWEAGARPVTHASGLNQRWAEQTQYGTAPAEAAERILAEWEMSGRQADPEGLWFDRIG